MKEIAYTAQLSGSLFLDQEGVWFHNGQPFSNPKVSELFHRSIVWDSNQEKYFIEIGNQRATFSSEEYVYFAITIDDAKTPWVASLLSGAKVDFTPETLACDSNGGVYFRLSAVQKVKLLRAAHQVLARYVVSDDCVEIAGKRYRIKLESQ